MRRICLLLVCLLLYPAARAEEWPADRPLSCRDDSTPCQVLQMVMMGAFSALDAQDGLSVRVHAAALPRLTALTEADITHFTGEFQVSQEALTPRLYAALGHCLWAEILLSRQDEALSEDVRHAREVALLFLAPAASARSMESRAIIRSQLTDELIVRMAGLLGVEAAFLEHLFYSDDWRAPSPTP